ncbi:MAG: hypothetical protein GTO02_22340 [Candidatus Dadabacteria bacterium]|nr:hypothetical protein [Candidatus Dadabacteria bacterium]
MKLPIKLSQKEYDRYNELTRNIHSIEDNDDWQLFFYQLSIKYKFNPILASITNAGYIHIDKNPFINDKKLKEKTKKWKEKIKLIKEKREIYAKQKRRRVKRLLSQDEPIPEHLWVRAKDYQ